MPYQPLGNITLTPSGISSLYTALSGVFLDADNTNGSLLLQTDNVNAIYIDKYQNFCINGTTPTSQFNINSNDGNAITLQYNGTSNKSFLTLLSDGKLGISSTGGQVIISSGTNLNIANYNGSTGGLLFAGTLITSSATQLNFNNVTAGTASANKTLVLDSSSNIVGINSLTSTTLLGTIGTVAQPNITSLGTLSSLTVSGNLNLPGANGTTTGLFLNGVLVTATATQINNAAAAVSGTAGTVAASSAVIVDSNKSITGFNSLTAQLLNASTDAGASDGNVYPLNITATYTSAGTSGIGSALRFQAQGATALLNSGSILYTLGNVTTASTSSNIFIKNKIAGLETTGIKVLSSGGVGILGMGQSVLTIQRTTGAGDDNNVGTTGLIAEIAFQMPNNGGTIRNTGRFQNKLINSNASKTNYLWYCYDNNAENLAMQLDVLDTSGGQLTGLYSLTSQNITATTNITSSQGINTRNQLITYNSTKGNVITATTNSLYNTTNPFSFSPFTVFNDGFTAFGYANMTAGSVFIHEGFVTPLFSETYTYTITFTYMYYKIWVDGVFVANNTSINTTVQTATFTVANTANKKQLIYIQMWPQNATVNSCNLSMQWQSTSQSIVTIPVNSGPEIGEQVKTYSLSATSRFTLYDMVATATSPIKGEIILSSAGNLNLISSGLTTSIDSTNNFNIAGHNGTTLGLQLAGTLVTSSAVQLNYNNVTAGTAAASKALILDSSSNITGINSLSATSLAGTLTTATQSNITTVGALTGLSIPSGVLSFTNWSLAGTTITATATQLNNLGTLSATPGTVSASSAVIVDSSKNIVGFNSLSSTSLVGLTTNNVNNVGDAAYNFGVTVQNDNTANTSFTSGMNFQCRNASGNYVNLLAIEPSIGTRTAGNEKSGLDLYTLYNGAAYRQFRILTTGGCVASTPVLNGTVLNIVTDSSITMTNNTYNEISFLGNNITWSRLQVAVNTSTNSGFINWRVRYAGDDSVIGMTLTPSGATGGDLTNINNITNNGNILTTGTITATGGIVGNISTTLSSLYTYYGAGDSWAILTDSKLPDNTGTTVTTTIYDIAYSPTLRIYVGTTRSSTFYYSYNGYTWTSYVASGFTRSYDTIVWADTLGLFVTVANDAGTISGQVATSVDGLNWISRFGAASGPTNIRGLAWSTELGLLVACSFTASTTNGIIYSTDGSNWFIASSIPSLSQATSQYTKVIWTSSLSQFVITGNSQLLYSPSGTTNWNAATTTPANNLYVSVAYSPVLSKYNALPANSGGVGATSTDATSWTTYSPGSYYNDIAWIDELNGYVATTATTGVSDSVSTNGTTWSACSRVVSDAGSPQLKVRYFVETGLAYTTGRTNAAGNGTILISAGVTPTKLYLGTNARENKLNTTAILSGTHMQYISNYKGMHKWYNSITPSIAGLGYNELMSLSSTGLGVNWQNPSVKLDVYNGGTGEVLRLRRTATGYAKLGIDSSNGLTITSTTATNATSYSAGGTCTITGGCGISGKLYVNGNVFTNGTFNGGLTTDSPVKSNSPGTFSAIAYSILNSAQTNYWNAPINTTFSSNGFFWTQNSNFNYEYSGFIKPIYTETYTYSVVTDNSHYRIWFDGDLVHQNTTAAGGAVTTTFTVAETANVYRHLFIQIHPLTTGSGNDLNLFWQSTSQSNQSIPDASLTAALMPYNIHSKKLSAATSFSLYDITTSSAVPLQTKFAVDTSGNLSITPGNGRITATVANTTNTAYPFSVISTSVNSGSNTNMMSIGRDNTTSLNSGVISFTYNSSGDVNNALGLGLRGSTNIITLSSSTITMNLPMLTQESNVFNCYGPLQLNAAPQIYATQRIPNHKYPVSSGDSTNYFMQPNINNPSTIFSAFSLNNTYINNTVVNELSGFIKPIYSETYTFSIISTQTYYKLWFVGDLVATNTSTLTNNTVNVNLVCTANKPFSYYIQIFGQDASASTFVIQWQSTSQTLANIPASALISGDVRQMANNQKYSVASKLTIYDPALTSTSTPIKSELVTSSNGNLSLTTSGTTISTASTNSFDILGHNGTNAGLKLNSILVTSTAAELNYNSGLTPGTASSTKSLVTDSSNNIGGINTLSTTTLYINGSLFDPSASNAVLSGVTPGTVSASKAVIVDANKDITGFGNLTANNLAGTLLTGTQTNITSVGTLTSLTVSGVVTSTSSVNSTNSTTGALVLSGGIAISSTADAVNNTNGGTITSAGGAAFAKSVYIGNNLTVAGNLSVAGTVTSIQSINTTLTDNLILLNSGPAGSGYDSGILNQRYQVDNTSGTGDVVNDAAAISFTLILATGTTLTLPNTASSVDNYYNNWWIKVTSGAANNTVRQITSYVGATRIATLDSSISTPPGVGDTVNLYNTNYTGLFWQESNKRFCSAFTVSDPSQAAVNVTSYTDFTCNNLLLQSSGPNSIYTPGSIVSTNTTDASSSTVGGTLTLAGGAAIAKALYVGTSVNASSVVATTLSGTLNTASQPNITTIGTLSTLSVSGAVTMSSTTDATSSTAGGVLTISGGCAIAKSLYVGITVNASSVVATTLTGTISTASQPNINSVNVLNIANHNGSSIGLQLAGTLVTSTAAQLNYTNVTAGTASASKALVLNSSSNISGINNIGTTTLSVGSPANTNLPLEVGYVTYTYAGAYAYNNSDNSHGLVDAGNGPSANYSIRTDGRILATGEIDVASDRRLKHKINNLENQFCENFINTTNPISFEYKNNKNQIHYGYIAQDIYKLGFTDLVGISKYKGLSEEIDEDGFISPANSRYTLCTAKIIPILAVNQKRLLNDNNEKDKKIKDLEERISKLESLIKELII